MRQFLLFSVAAVALTCAAPGQAASSQATDAPPRLFEGRDLFGLRYASQPEIRPDGAVVAYVRVTNDIMTDRARRAIWTIDLKTGAQTPVTGDEGSSFAPRWSPDGARLAYVAAAPGASPQIFVRWMASGQTARVATLESAPASIAWSPDGRSIAFTMQTPAEGEKLGSAPAKPEGRFDSTQPFSF